MLNFASLILCLIAFVVSCSALISAPARSVRSTAVMGMNPVASGFASTRAGKTAILERTKALIDESGLIVALPFSGVSVEEIDMLRKSLPEGTTASVVKNTIMKLAVQDTPFSSMAEQEDLTQSNIFFFIPEGEAKPTFKAFKAWTKETNKKEMNPKFGIMEGQVYRAEGLEVVSNLPTKLELITKIAQGIKAVPTKVGKGINAVPNKLGRAFGALRDKIEEDEKA